jgi:hypothetical protein
MEYATVNLAYSFLAAAAGGFVTAWTSAIDPLNHVLVLAVIVLVMGGLSALQIRGKQPVWYAVTLVALAPIGVMAGGWMRLHFLGMV